LFIFNHWPNKSFDRDCMRGSVKNGEEFLDNLFERLTAPLTTQTHDC